MSPPPPPPPVRRLPLRPSGSDTPGLSTRRVWVFIAASIFLHLLLLLLIFSGLFSRLRVPEIQARPDRLTLTLVPQSPTPPAQAPSLSAQARGESTFLDTSGLTPIPAPEPNAAFEGETNTAALSRLPGEGNPALPNQQGEARSGLEFFNSQYSPEQAVPLTPPPAPEPLPNPTPKPPQDSAENPASRSGVKENLRANTSARIQMADAEMEKEREREREREKEKEKAREANRKESRPAAQPSQETSAAPASFSAYKRENRIEGGAPRGDSNSASARESEIGRYKAKLYRAIGSRWYQYIHQDNGTISLGVVRLRFYVRKDGVIQPPEVIEGIQHSALLAVSRRSVMEVSGQLEPFSENMRQQLGDGYYEEVSFSIY